MLHIDKKYATLLSPKLPLFGWTGANTAAFRCPICGDSKKSKLKKRGYIYADKDSLWMKCHNCEVAMSFSKFLKSQDEALYKEYAYEKYKHDNNARWQEHNTNKKVEKLKKDLVKEELDLRPLEHLTSLDKLPLDHVAVQYVIARKIPLAFWSKLFYTQNYRKWVNSFIPDKFKTIGKEDERLVIPFFDVKGNAFAYQGRYIGQNPKATRYITIHEKADGLLIYGLERVNLDRRIYVVEGPIDSMFPPNCLAVAGSALKKLLSYKAMDLVFVFDNQPRSPTVVRLMKDIIALNKNIVIFPETVTEKDINDMIKSGLTSRQLSDMLHNNTFQGMNAQLRFNKWKKI